MLADLFSTGAPAEFESFTPITSHFLFQSENCSSHLNILKSSKPPPNTHTKFKTARPETKIACAAALSNTQNAHVGEITLLEITSHSLASLASPDDRVLSF